MSMKIKYF